MERRPQCVMADGIEPCMTGDRRILVITELFMPTKGGTAIWFDEAYRRIGGKGTHILTADVPGSQEHDRDHANTIHRMRLQRYSWIRPASLVIYAKLFLVGLIVGLRHDFEEVHAGRVLPEGLVALFISRLIKRPLIVYAHGEEITTWQRSIRRLKGMKYTYQRAFKIIANSRFTRDELRKLGIEDGKIVIIYPGVDIERFRPLANVKSVRERIGMNGEQKIILSVGRLSRRKGFDNVIRALALLLNRGLDAHYFLVGVGDDRNYLESVCEQEGMENRVHFLGHVSAEELPQLYSAADVFVMPNRVEDGDTEGFGMVFLEAAACARPAVAGLAGGTGDAVVDHQTGLRVNGNSIEEIGLGLATLLEDDELAKKLGLNGLDRVNAEFSWAIVAKKTDNVLASFSSKNCLLQESRRED